MYFCKRAAQRTGAVAAVRQRLLEDVLGGLGRQPDLDLLGDQIDVDLLHQQGR